jgi:CheY-like chemotaxis protein
MIDSVILILHFDYDATLLKKMLKTKVNATILYSPAINSFIYNLKANEKKLKLIVVIGADKDQALLVANKAQIPTNIKTIIYTNKEEFNESAINNSNVIIIDSNNYTSTSVLEHINNISEVKNANKILIVEDEEINQDIIKTTLEKLNISIRSAFTGAEALKEINEYKPDLILLDFYLPDMNGDTVLDFIRSKYSKAEMPVLIISSQEDKENVIKLGKLGVNGYIVKPFKAKMLLDKVSLFTKRKASI